MKVSFIVLTVFLVSSSLILSVSAASWHDIESQTMRVGSLHNNYFYTVHGPYTENGLAYNGLINVLISFQDQTPFTFTLSNGATYSFSSQHQARILFWNLTTDYNESRQMSFGSSFNNEVYLYVANRTIENLVSYDVSITDMVGLTNATCETDKNILGVNQIIERQTFDPVNLMSFYLLRFSDYDVKVTSDQGTFIWHLPTDIGTSFSQSITRDLLPQNNSVNAASASATRLNGTCASVYFYDPSQSTTTVTTTIYILNVTGKYSSYVQTDAGYVQNFTLYNLDPDTNYLALTVTSQGSWSNQLPIPSIVTSRWGVSFDIFGDWALYARNAVGMFVVMALISVGSWKDTEWFLGAGVVVCAVLVSIGFLTVPWTGIAMALLVVLLMYIDKAKKELPYS